MTAIGGLQPFLCAHRHSRLQTPEFGNRARLGRKTTGVTKTPPADDNVPPFMVSEILKAYDAEDLSETGDGQIIAILIDTFPDDDDVKAFWSKNGIPGNLARIEKINVKGGSLPPPAGEETLDVEWSSGIAQKARIRVYATGSLAFVDLDRALDEIIADVPKFAGLRQLSISLGLGETYLGGPTGEIATQHQKFLRLAAAGVNVFMSSGDAGSNPDQTGHSSSGPAQAEYAASDSCVIGVGGTSLSLTSRGTVARETGWANGGGGVSKFFDQPSWQKAKGAPKSKKRLVPDVSLVADPETGAFLILAGKATQIGGTSWSAPVGRLSARYATRPGKRQKKTHCRFSIPLSTSSPAHPLSATSMPAAMGCIPPIPDSTLSPDLVCQA